VQNDADDMTHNLALYGITGALGREIQIALEVEHEGIEQLFPVAGVRSAGQLIRWRGDTLPVTAPAELKASDVDFAIFATPAEVVSREAPRLLDAGARVLDASGVLASAPLPKALPHPAPVVWPRLSSFATVDLETETALVLPSPGASTLASLLDALTLPEAHLPRLEAVAVTVLLPASHAGRAGIDALSRQAVGLLNYQPVLEPKPFPAVLAFNAVAPPTDASVLFEAQVASELRRLVPTLGDIPIELTPIWIAAFSGIVASLHLRFAGDVDPATLTKLLAAHPDLVRDDGDEANGGGNGDGSDIYDLDEPAAPELDADGDSTADDAPRDDPAALSLRSVMDSERIRVGAPLYGKHTVRLVLMADPIHRTAAAVSTLLTRWMAALA